MFTKVFIASKKYIVFSIY